VTAVYFVLISRFIAPLRPHFEWRLARRLVGEVKAFAATSALGALFARPEVIILSLLSSPVQVGYYSAALRLAEVWLFVPQVFMSNVYSVLSRSHHLNDGRFRSIQGQAIKYTFAFCLPLSVGLFVAADPIVAALFGTGFGPAADALRLLAISLTFFSLMEVFWPSLFAVGRQASVLRVQLYMVVARLGGCAALVIWLDALGAAIAATVNSALHLALLMSAARRHGGHAPIVANGWRTALAALSMGAIVALAAHWLTIWLVVPLAAVSYVGAALLFRVFSRAELRGLRNLIARPGGIDQTSTRV
jgi:O-antigen/teichoic acid export membrane protein